ncbi:MAG: xanthine dehydrogenase family protein molybdopterin-binding subunit [Solirubrobacterales bacterium]|nr:xanthine dehydrogenase family protein molybdopterin-binding subunit [Solirubrobacterales bacterium]
MGESVLRKEDGPLLTGEGCFADDLELPGAAHVAVLRSPHAHAELGGEIDTSAARALPGVLEVITAADLPEDVLIPMRMFKRPGMERFLQPPLARGRVRYSGEPVAFAIAESRYLAEDAIELIDPTYEPLDPSLGGPGSLAPDAPILFEQAGTNLAAEFDVGEGRAAVDAAFEAAETVVAETVEIQRHAAVPMEGRGLAAAYDPASDRVTVWGASKIVHVNRRILAALLGWEEERVRLVELDVGGGFGARGEFYPEDYLIPWAAIRLGRPVRWAEDREEHLRSTNHSREQTHEIELALGPEGEFLGLRDRVTFNTGAYVRTAGVLVPNMTAALLPGPYRWGAYRCELRQVVTNKTPAGTYRAPGRYEANFARERMIDIAAHRLGIEPDDLRRRNLIEPGAMPYANGTHTDGHPVSYDSGDYPKLLTKGSRLFGKKRMREWRAAEPPPGRRRGLGIAFFVEKSGIARWDYSRVELSEEGRATLFVGSASIGQGVETVLAQICAEALGIGYDDVAEVRHGDTDEVPDGMGSFGSRATMIAGSAVHNASLALRGRLFARAAELLEASEDDLELAGGDVVVRGSPSRGVPLSELAELAEIDGVDAGLSEEARFTSEDMSFPYGVHLVAVEVDVETGGVEIERYAIAYDVGRAVNPALVEGQIVGGAAQGIGGALLEELSYDASGQLASGSFIDYLLPTAGEMPPVEVLVTEDAPTPLTPVGAKGAGEGGTPAAGAAIANAVCDALGAETTALPLTPERVREMARQS